MLELYKEKNEVLLRLIESEINPLKRVNYCIEQFYTEDTIEIIEKQNEMKPTKYVSKDEADKLVDAKTKKYNKIIGFLELKVLLLTNSLSSIQDELELVNTKLLIEKELKPEILAKRSFIEAWIERKKVV